MKHVRTRVMFRGINLDSSVKRIDYSCECEDARINGFVCACLTAPMLD